MMKTKLTFAAIFLASVLGSSLAYSSDNFSTSDSISSVESNSISVNQKVIATYSNWSKTSDTLSLIQKVKSWQNDSIRQYMNEYLKTVFNGEELIEIKNKTNQFYSQLKINSENNQPTLAKKFKY